MLLLAAETASETTVTWTTPTVVVAILAPAVALIGVLISNWWNGRNAIKAEDKRHANALVAEGVRHQNAMEAEGRRHANSLRQLTYSTVVTKTNDLYADIEAARHRLASAAQMLTNSLYNANTWNAGGEKNSARLDEAISKFREMRARSALTASKEVALLCDEVWESASFLSFMLIVVDPPIQQDAEGEAFLDQGSNALEALSGRLDALLQRMRQELHGTP